MNAPSSRTPLDVAVLGAGGTIAAAIVRDLAESDEVARLRLLDLDERRAADVARTHGSGKASAARVDARDAAGPNGLANALAGCDVLVNSASYRINIEAMEAALGAGCHYLDLGGLYWMTARQLELHARFRQAGRIAVLGIGSSPGKTNVMAAAAVRALAPDAVRSIHVSAASRDPEAVAVQDAASPLRLPYSLQTLLDEITMAPVVLRDGRPVELPALAEGGEVHFDEPIGAAATIHTLHSELQTFGSSFGCEQVSFRLSLAGPLLERLSELVRASAEEVAETARHAVPQSAQTVSCHVIEAASEHRRARVSALTRPTPEWGLGGGVVSTAAPAAAAVRLLARGAITATGVHPPEVCIEPDQLFAELERRACTFTTEIEQGAPA
jgi:lysine 6-dehydrogenase